MNFGELFSKQENALKREIGERYCIRLFENQKSAINNR